MKEYEKVFLKYQRDENIISMLNDEKYKKFIRDIYLAGKQDCRSELLGSANKNFKF